MMKESGCSCCIAALKSTNYGATPSPPKNKHFA